MSPRRVRCHPAGGLSLLLATLRRSDLSPPGRLEYDASDDSQLVSGFGLSDGLAAEAPRDEASGGARTRSCRSRQERMHRSVPF